MLRQFIRNSLLANMPPRWLLIRPPRASPENGCRLSLTFDDGPHPHHTMQLLKVLRKWNQLATFFVVGEKVESYPEVVKEIVGQGHQVANHTWSHSEPATTSAHQFLNEIERVEKLLDKLAGPHQKWTRPPKGELSFTKTTGLWRRGHSIALWNVDPRDYRMTHRADITGWCEQYAPTDGDIILMHDCHPWAAEIVDRLGDLGIFDSYPSTTIDGLLTSANIEFQQSVNSAAVEN